MHESHSDGWVDSTERARTTSTTRIHSRANLIDGMDIVMRPDRGTTSRRDKVFGWMKKDLHMSKMHCNDMVDEIDIYGFWPKLVSTMKKFIILWKIKCKSGIKRKTETRFMDGLVLDTNFLIINYNTNIKINYVQLDFNTIKYDHIF